MKPVAVILLLVLALPPAAKAQDATPKPVRKLFGIPFGKKAEPTPTPVPATPTATPKATPKPAPKATPKPVAKAADKATPAPKATEPAPEKVVEKMPETAADKLSEKFTQVPEEKPIETIVVRKSAATPAPPAATPPPAARVATPPPYVSNPPLVPVIKAPERTVSKPPENPVKPPENSVKPPEKLPENSVKPPERSVKLLENSFSPAVITSTVPPEPAQIVRSFFALLGKGDIDAAYASLMKGSRIGERPDEVRGLKAKTKEAITLFGTVHGYDLVDTKPVGERLMRATYLSLGHELPLRWRFYFYKAEADWKLIDLRVDDKLTGIFDEVPDDAVRTSDLR